MIRPSFLCLLTASLLALRFAVGQWVPRQCGAPPVDETSVCDDGNRLNGDGCDSNCILERLAIQHWYSSADCSGPRIKMVIRNIREYLIPQGTCETGARCTCPFDYTTGCEDGSNNLYTGCSCVTPNCNMYQTACKVWTSPNSTRKWSYLTNCTNTWPVVTAVDPQSPTRANIILKEWGLTTSRGVIAPLADISAWELTRRRALGIGEPDQWHIYSNNLCMPSWSDLDLGEGLTSTLWETHEYRNGWSRRRCDENCTNCMMETQSSATLCRDALNCLIVSPGKCMSCIGQVANRSIVGFKAHPGPPAPDRNRCVPCSFAPLNDYYGDSLCSMGMGCGICETGMACGGCGDQGAPAVACGDQRLGGLPYTWVTGQPTT